MYLPSETIEIILLPLLKPDISPGTNPKHAVAVTGDPEAAIAEGYVANCEAGLARFSTIRLREHIESSQ